MRKIKTEKGITLVALIVTVVVLLTLAGVAINEARSTRIIGEAKNTTSDFSELQQTEHGMLNGLFDSLNGNNNNNAPENIFIWESDVPGEFGYGTIIGYTAYIDNYVSLRFPQRCTKIEITYLENIGDEEARREMRRYTGNIREIELPRTITEIGEDAFGDYEFNNLVKITYDGTMQEWKNIIKGNNWNAGISVTYVQCIDGTVSLVYDEGLFIWASDDPSNAGYGTIVGYTSMTQAYPTLVIPDRCTKIEINLSALNNIMRSYTSNVKEIELPDTITEIGHLAFGEYYFSSLKKINIPRSVKKIGEYAFNNCTALTSIMFEGPRNEWESISKGALWNEDVPAEYVQCLDGVIYLD